MMENLTTAEWELVFTGAAVVVLLVIAALLTYAISAYAPAASGGGSGSSDASGIWHLIQREPVRVRAAATAILGAVGVLLASLGIDIDPAVMASLIGVIAAVAFAISELSRPAVTPVADPIVPKGTTVKRI